VPGPEVADWVLARPVPDDEEKANRVLEILPEVLEEMIKVGVISAMNNFNGNKTV
jgi:PTH1 family peptidyl-tRNA hydrolase